MTEQLVLQVQRCTNCEEGWRRAQYSDDPEVQRRFRKVNEAIIKLWAALDEADE